MPNVVALPARPSRRGAVNSCSACRRVMTFPTGVSSGWGVFSQIEVEF
jgi:hypothetical protein